MEERTFGAEPLHHVACHPPRWENSREVPLGGNGWLFAGAPPKKKHHSSLPSTQYGISRSPDYWQVGDWYLFNYTSAENKGLQLKVIFTF